MDFVSFWRTCERMDFVCFSRTCERTGFVSAVSGGPVNLLSSVLANL